MALRTATFISCSTALVQKCKCHVKLCKDTKIYPKTQSAHGQESLEESTRGQEPLEESAREQEPLEESACTTQDAWEQTAQQQ